MKDNSYTIAQAHTNEGGIGESPKKKRKFGDVLVNNREEIKEELQKSAYISDLARKYGVEWHTMAAFIHADDELEQALKDGVETLSDMYEKRLHELAFREQEMASAPNGIVYGRHDGKVMATNFNACKFWLQQRAPQRGYGAKIETNEVGNGRVPIILAAPISEGEIAEAEKMVAEATKVAIEDDYYESD